MAVGGSVAAPVSNDNALGGGGGRGRVTAGAGRRRRPDPAQGLLDEEGGISGGGWSSGDRCWRRFANRLCDFANIGRNSASTSTE